jgi:zinc transporter ZupT
MVIVAHYLALTGLVLLAGAIIGVVLLTFSLVTGDTGGVVAASVAAVMLVVLWLLVPLGLRSHPKRSPG